MVLDRLISQLFNSNKIPLKDLNNPDCSSGSRSSRSAFGYGRMMVGLLPGLQMSTALHSTCVQTMKWPPVP